MRKIKQNSIIFVILYGLIFYSINFILSINNIVFMNWIYYFSNGYIFYFLSNINNLLTQK